MLNGVLKMVAQRRQDKQRTSKKQRTAKTTMHKKIFLRTTLILLIGILIFIGIGWLKYGNIKKVNDQPKPFPVTVQN